MKKIGVISKVDKPTLWCAGMVVVPKKSGDVRICVDLKPLNESVLRETHPLPGVDEILAQMTGATVMSKLDANSGFWQIPLTKDSRELTTFITPFGHYCFNKLPFGISRTPEHFQKKMCTILDNLPGVLCLMDDILIFGKDQKEHDARLTTLCFYRKTNKNGDQWLMLPLQCQRLRLDMPKLRKKLSPLHGLVRNSLPTFWENTSALKLITNL